MVRGREAYKGEGDWEGKGDFGKGEKRGGVGRVCGGWEWI